MYLTPENCVFCFADLRGKRGLGFPFTCIHPRQKIASLGWKKKIDKWKGSNIYIVHKNRVIPKQPRVSTEQQWQWLREGNLEASMMEPTVIGVRLRGKRILSGTAIHGPGFRLAIADTGT